MKSSSNRSLVIAAFAAIGSSVCCAGPLLLLSLGIGGAWISNLTAMEPYSPYFTAATLIVLIVVFRKLYTVPQACEEEAICSNPDVLKNQRFIFWVVAPVLVALIMFQYYAEYIID